MEVVHAHSNIDTALYSVFPLDLLRFLTVQQLKEGSSRAVLSDNAHVIILLVK